MKQRTACVLSGGGSLGAVQVGMLKALQERGIVADLLVGTSAGALNAAFLASHGVSEKSLVGLADSWRSARRTHLFPVDPIRHTLALLGRQQSLFSSRGLRKMIEGNLDFVDLQEAPLELHAVATDLLSGEEVALSSGDATDAVLASTAFRVCCPRSRGETWRLSTAVWQTMPPFRSPWPLAPIGYSCCQRGMHARSPHRRRVRWA